MVKIILLLLITTNIYAISNLDYYSSELTKEALVSYQKMDIMESLELMQIVDQIKPTQDSKKIIDILHKQIHLIEMYQEMLEANEKKPK